MDSAISRLLKILALEKKQGYRNKAVIGGLDKFVSRWESDARAEAGNTTAINEIIALLLGYPAIDDPAARERILEQVIRRAREIGNGSASPERADPAALIGGRAAASPPPAAGPPVSPVAPPRAPAPPTRPGEEARAEKPLDRAAESSIPARSKPASFMPPLTPPAALSPVEPPPPPAAMPLPPEDEPESFEIPHRMVTAPAAPGLGLEAPVTRLPGVGPSYAQKLAKLGVQTVRDLLYLLPHRYDDYSKLQTIDRLKWGEEVTVIGTVWSVKSRIIGEDRKMLTAVVGDGTGEMHMTWFNPFVEKQLHTGYAYAFSGKVDSYRGVMTIRHPNFEPLDRNQLNTGRLVPIYPLTEGLTNVWLLKLMRSAINTWAEETADFLPQPIRQEAGLLPLAQALTQIHFPDGQAQLAAAHQRLSFDEFFVLQLGVLAARQRFQGQPGRALQTDETTVGTFLAALPFSLTDAQRRALTDILADLTRPQPMSRLLQGDVGSGKTAVAAAALWTAVTNSAQGAIMAPTEILAEQHARSFGRMFEGLLHPTLGRPIRIVTLTGSQRAAEREGALSALASGDADIAIGTHALVQQGVEFHDLAVAVVDEQHRFGVEQRATLRQKGVQPHMLVMSATPIPRSLALTIYGDLDISVIDEMPAGRTPIKTKWLTTSQRERAYDFIRRQVHAGRQAFVIYPLVEESETSDAKAAVEEHARLAKTVFADLRVGLLHGRLKGDEKDTVMRAFSAGELDVLVATSVVEVGIDVPNATVMLIEGAERFGLAQLHQFRGRVGRGQHASFCILISDVEQGDGVRRLQALETNNDGFALAQIDLDLRGPGDFFGTQQSGLPPLQTAQLSDVRTLELARTAARKLFSIDPDLSQPQHRALAAQVAAFWRGSGDVS